MYHPCGPYGDDSLLLPTLHNSASQPSPLFPHVGWADEMLSTTYCQRRHHCHPAWNIIMCILSYVANALARLRSSKNVFFPRPLLELSLCVCRFLTHVHHGHCVLSSQSPRMLSPSSLGRRARSTRRNLRMSFVYLDSSRALSSFQARNRFACCCRNHQHHTIRP